MKEEAEEEINQSTEIRRTQTFFLIGYIGTLIFINGNLMRFRMLSITKAFWNVHQSLSAVLVNLLCSCN